MAVLYWSGLICASTSIGVALIAEDLTNFVLGPQWADVAKLMPWFALACGVLGVSETVDNALDTIGRPAVATKLQWLRVAVLTFSVVLVAYSYQSILSIAITRFVVTAALSPILFVVLSRHLEMTPRGFVATIWRPLVAALMMAIVVLFANSQMTGGPLRLFVDIALGTVTYGVSLMLLCQLGVLEGAEAEFYRNVRRRLRSVVGFSQPAEPVTMPSPAPEGWISGRSRNPRVVAARDVELSEVDRATR